MSRKQNNLIAVCSGIKGVGKTCLATNLCHCLAAMRQKVLFFDADCGLENVSYHLGLNSSQSYLKILHGALTLNNAVQKFDKGRFDIISCLSGENALSAAPIGRAQILARDLLHFSKYYERVIIDCEDDEDKAIHSFLNIAGTIILITNANPESAIVTYAKLEKLKKINPTANFQIIINRALSYDEGLHTYNNILQAATKHIKLKINLLGVVRQDPRIREAVLNKSLLLTRYPTCEGAEDMALLTRNLMEKL